jgi:hypothetical protein
MINTNPLDFMLFRRYEGMSQLLIPKHWIALVFADGANKVIGAMGNNTTL